MRYCIRMWWAFYRGFRGLGRSVWRSVLWAFGLVKVQPRPPPPNTLFGFPIVWRDGREESREGGVQDRRNSEGEAVSNASPDQHPSPGW